MTQNKIKSKMNENRSKGLDLVFNCKKVTVFSGAGVYVTVCDLQKN